jgi:hypothetical protein
MVSARKQGPSSALHVGPKIESRRRRPSAEILLRYFAFARDVAPRNMSSRVFPPKAGCLLSNPRAWQVTRSSLVSGFSLIVFARAECQQAQVALSLPCPDCCCCPSFLIVPLIPSRSSPPPSLSHQCPLKRTSKIIFWVLLEVVGYEVGKEVRSKLKLPVQVITSFCGKVSVLLGFYLIFTKGQYHPRCALATSSTTRLSLRWEQDTFACAHLGPAVRDLRFAGPTSHDSIWDDHGGITS